MTGQWINGYNTKMNNMEIRKLEIIAFIQGYLTACTEFKVDETKVVLAALQATIAKFNDLPEYRIALEEVIKSLSIQK
jgi:hypothetical protein